MSLGGPTILAGSTVPQVYPQSVRPPLLVRHMVLEEQKHGECPCEEAATNFDFYSLQEKQGMTCFSFAFQVVEDGYQFFQKRKVISDRVCLSVCLSVSQSVCLSAYLPVCLILELIPDLDPLGVGLCFPCIKR